MASATLGTSFSDAHKCLLSFQELCTVHQGLSGIMVSLGGHTFRFLEQFSIGIEGSGIEGNTGERDLYRAVGFAFLVLIVQDWACWGWLW